MVDWIVGAVGIKIQGLRAAQTGRPHSDGIDLGEASLLWVVVTVESVVEGGVQAAVVGRESAVRSPIVAPVGGDSLKGVPNGSVCYSK
jgi:hypothetical protein